MYIFLSNVITSILMLRYLLPCDVETSSELWKLGGEKITQPPLGIFADKAWGGWWLLDGGNGRYTWKLKKWRNLDMFNKESWTTLRGYDEVFMEEVGGQMGLSRRKAMLR